MKLGLVLEGGASRTYFSVGVMDALLDNNIMADYVIGTSAGIANAISYVSRQKGRSLDIGLTFLNDKRYMGYRHFFKKNNRSYYNIDFVFDEIPNKHIPFDYEAYSEFEGSVYAVVTNLSTGKAEYLPVTADDKSWKTIVASCALPIMFRPIELSGKLYLDGGVADPIPFARALEDGCDKIITVLTREKEYVKTDGSEIKFASLIYRKYPEFYEAIKQRSNNYNNSRQKLSELEDEKTAYVISPKNTADWKRTDKSSVKIMEMYNEGYKSVTSELGKIKAFLK